MLPGGVIAGRHRGGGGGGGGAVLPFVSTFSGASFGREFVPAGAVSVTVTLIGPGGGGSRVNAKGGYGAGGGARMVFTLALVPADAGKWFDWAIGEKGLGRSGSIGNGQDGGTTGIGTTLDAYSGSASVFLAKGATTSLPGAGGTGSASGGLTFTLTPGGGGFLSHGGASGSGAQGGAVAGSAGANYGGGGAGGWLSDGIQYDGGNGGDGQVIFAWS